MNEKRKKEKYFEVVSEFFPSFVSNSSSSKL